MKRVRLILDRSGSMAGREQDTVGGVNTFLADQRKVDGQCEISMVRFDQVIETFRPWKDVREVPDLTPSEYQPRGSTALLDAVGASIIEMDDGSWWTASRGTDAAIIVIVTDGQENASSKYKLPEIKAMIEKRVGSGKWTFIYLGADVNAFGEAASMGIPRQDSAGFSKTMGGMRAAYQSVSNAVANTRATGSTMSALHKENLGEEEIGKSAFIIKDPK